MVAPVFILMSYLWFQGLDKGILFLGAQKNACRALGLLWNGTDFAMDVGSCLV